MPYNFPTSLSNGYASTFSASIRRVPATRPHVGAPLTSDTSYRYSYKPSISTSRETFRSSEADRQTRLNAYSSSASDKYNINHRSDHKPYRSERGLFNKSISHSNISKYSTSHRPFVGCENFETSSNLHRGTASGSNPDKFGSALASLRIENKTSSKKLSSVINEKYKWKDSKTSIRSYSSNVLGNTEGWRTKTLKRSQTLDTAEDPLCMFNKLPLDLFEKIMENIQPWQDRIRLDRVCCYWREHMPFREAKAVTIKADTKDAALQLISNLVHCSHILESLTVDKYDIWLDGIVLEEIGKCDRLVELILKVGKIEISKIPPLQNLQVLQLDISESIERDGKGSKIFSQTLPLMSSLKKLYFATDSTFEVYFQHPGLEKLRIKCNYFATKHLNYMLAGCPVLEEFTVSSNNLTDISSVNLITHTALKRLSFDDCPRLTDEDLTNVAEACPTLISLFIFGCPEVSTLQVLCLLPNLEILNMDDRLESLEWDEVVDNMPDGFALKEFSYVGPQMNDVILAALATRVLKLESIYIFNWGSWPISAGGVRFALSLMTKLRKLLIPYSSLGDDVFDILLDEGKELEIVALQSSGCTQEGFMNFLLNRAERIHNGEQIAQLLTVRVNGFQADQHINQMLHNAMVQLHQ